MNKKLAKLILKNWYHLPHYLHIVNKYSKNKKNYSKEERFTPFNYCLKLLKKSVDLTIEVDGQQNIPQNTGFIFYSNHQGIFDFYALIEAYDKPFSVVSKIETSKKFVAKDVLKCMDSIYLDRQDARQAIKAMKEVQERVEKGDVILIFPEGTRSRKGNEMNEFKAGSFKPAKSSKCPIVPIALVDSFKVIDGEYKGPITVKISILKPILYEEYMNLSTQEIAHLVQERIAESIKEHIK